MPAACSNSTRCPPHRFGGTTDSTITRNRPFFLLRSTNPVFSPGIGYFRREDRARTAGLSDVKLVNDEYAAYLGWNPAGGPQSDFQFLRTHTFDGERAYQDVTKDFGSLVSNYTYRNLGAYYRGSYLDTDDQLDGARDPPGDPRRPGELLERLHPETAALERDVQRQPPGSQDAGERDRAGRWRSP